MMLPVGSQFRVIRATDPSLDAWRGAAKWAFDVIKRKQTSEFFVSRADYQEMGGDYLVSRFLKRRVFIPFF